MNMCSRPIAALALLFCAGCATTHAPLLPQGAISATGGGLAGYQHGAEGGKFAVGDNMRMVLQYGYHKQTGDEGTLAIRQSSGEAVGVPRAGSAGLRLPPYGSSPDDHDTFVRAYFVGLGLPAEQVQGVRCMTLLEASGRADEATQPIPRVTAYYSVLTRAVGGVPVPDSFAWARANAEGRIVHEGVYWPAVPESAVAEARKFKELLADPEQRRKLESRIGISIAPANLAIRHAGPSEDTFEAFASLDVTVRSIVLKPGDTRAQQDSPVSGAAVVKHFDMSGRERFLPQERLHLKDQYPVTKAVAQQPRPPEPN